jgi:PleD family two-component response regulator
VAQWIPGESMEQLLGRADQMLYQAKSDGRNCVRVAVPGTMVATD